jgi:3-dehydroquinate synthase
MAVDKKVRGGQVRLVLLEKIGRAIVTATFQEAMLNDTLRHFSKPQR